MDSPNTLPKGISLPKENLAILGQPSDLEPKSEMGEEWSGSESEHSDQGSVPDLVEAEPEPLAQITLANAPTPREYKPMPAHPSERFAEFHLFPFLPMELRLKIWSFNPGPQILRAFYDINSFYLTRLTHLNGYEHYGTWTFKNGFNTLSNRAVCQESRSESLKLKYNVIRMRLDINEPHHKRRLFNFDTDTIFFDTNGRKEHNRNKRVLSPINNPVSLVGGASDENFGENVKWAAVSSALWMDWPFSPDYGPNVHCRFCLGYGEDDSHPIFKGDFIHQMKKLKHLQIVKENTRAEQRVDLFKKKRKETRRAMVESEFEKEGRQEVTPFIEIVDKLPVEITRLWLVHISPSVHTPIPTPTQDDSRVWNCG